MSNGAAILAYFRYFLGHPWLYLTRAREVKIAESDLATGFIEIISAGKVSIWNISRGLISAKGAFAWGFCVNVGLSDIDSWLLIK